MKLFYSPGACSLAPHIAIEELGLKCDFLKADLGSKKTPEGDLTKYNPKGQVPTLVLDNGQVLTEGAVILQYLADQAPDKNLLPKIGSFERYRAQEWLNYLATEVHKGFGPLWNRQMPEEAKELARKISLKNSTF